MNALLPAFRRGPYIMRVMVGGGTLNDDLQASVAQTTARVGHDRVVVMNSCKDYRPLDHWVCLCLPALRFFHCDLRHFGPPSYVQSPKTAREFMALRLSEGGFSDANALWRYAIEHDLPRYAEPAALQRFGYDLATGLPRAAA